MKLLIGTNEEDEVDHHQDDFADQRYDPHAGCLCLVPASLRYHLYSEIIVSIIRNTHSKSSLVICLNDTAHQV